METNTEIDVDALVYLEEKRYPTGTGSTSRPVETGESQDTDGGYIPVMSCVCERCIEHRRLRERGGTNEGRT